MEVKFKIIFTPANFWTIKDKFNYVNDVPRAKMPPDEMKFQ